MDQLNQPWSDFDGPRLAASAAALQLLPENVPCLVRLERVAAVGAALPPNQSGARITADGMRRLLRDDLIDSKAVRAQEDEYDDVYVVEVPFHGGPKIALQGLCNRSGEIVTTMLEAILSADLDTFPTGFTNDTGDLAFVLLTISDKVCRSADLSRHSHFDRAEKRHISVPGASRLRSLSDIVTLDYSVLESSFSQRQMQLLDRVTVTSGEHNLELGDGTDDGLIKRPFVRARGNLIVANPAEMLSCLRHSIISMAVEHRCTHLLAEQYLNCVFVQVAQVLTRIAVPRGECLPTSNPAVKRQMFDGASGTVINLVVVADDLSNYDSDDPFGHWDAPISQWLANECVDAEASETDRARILQVNVVDTMARSSFAGISADPSPGESLLLRPDDVKAILTVDGTDPLGLWYFAVAERKFSETSRIFSFSTLDTYGIYRDCRFSFYVSDEQKPSMLSVAPSSGTDLRVEAKRREDRHFVLGPLKSTYVELIALYAGGSIPIYFPHPRHRIDASVVEFSELVIWIIDDIDGASRGSLREAVTYWVWQILANYPRVFENVADSDHHVYINVSMENLDSWFSRLNGSFDRENSDDEYYSQWVSCEVLDHGSIRITLDGRGVGALAAESNFAEKALVSSILAVILDDWDESDIETLVSKVIPSDRKRMLRLVPSSELGVRTPSVEVRVVNPSVSAHVMDRLGAALLSSGISPGKVPSADRTKVLRSVVDIYFHQLVGRVAILSIDGLLDFLMRQDESLLHAIEFDNYNLPGRIACFGIESGHIAESVQATQSRTEAAIASRFLVEYVAAVPPSGANAIDLIAYDELLSIAAELISRATLSDAINLNFSDVEISLLPSGRLGVETGGRYHAGFTEVLKVDTETRLAMASSAGDPHEAGLANLDRSTFRPEERTGFDRLEAAFETEFEFSIQHLVEFVSELVAIADDKGDEPCRVPHEFVVGRMLQTFPWSESTVDNLIQALALVPRSEFLSIKNDAYPWKLNREWSYSRRPLVREVSPDGQDNLVWCVRRVTASAKFWLDLVFTGRMRCRPSGALDRQMGSVRQSQNIRFEADVAQSLQISGAQHVLKSLKKIDGRRIVDANGNDLGDIDAIGIWPKLRLVVLAEAKDFEIARNPAELSNEVAGLLEGAKSAVEKHRKRCTWVSQHLNRLLDHCDIPGGAAGWDVLGVVVTSRELVGPRVVEGDMPVVSIGALPGWLEKVFRQPNGRRKR